MDDCFGGVVGDFVFVVGLGGELFFFVVCGVGGDCGYCWFWWW